MYFKQNTRNDCAYTCICMAMRESWILLKTKNESLNIIFRNFVDFPSQRIAKTPTNKHLKIRPKPNPYQKHAGLWEAQIKTVMIMAGFSVKRIGSRQLKDLDSTQLYFLDFRSKNYHHAGHLVIYNKGKLYDPSRKQQFKYSPYLEFNYALKLVRHSKTTSKVQQLKDLIDKMSSLEPKPLEFRVVTQWQVMAHITEAVDD